MVSTHRSKLIVANWKMNPVLPREAKKIFLNTKKNIQKKTNGKGYVVICPPAVFLPILSPYTTSRIKLGAQDVFWEEKGAYTGALSAGQLASSGASYVIVGHSEVRKRGDTDEIVSKKILRALNYQFIVFLCVGESERDGEGMYLSFLRQQLLSSLAGIPARLFSRIVIAYEPLWAIGEKARGASTPADFLEKMIFFKKTIHESFGKEAASSVRVLYGGSVNSSNAAGFLHEGRADGLLVGRASLDPQEFTEIFFSL